MQHKCRSIATILLLYVAPINKLMFMLTKGSKSADHFVQSCEINQ